MTFSFKKRPSSDESEFMPVTKRLNLLSIDNTSRESTSDSNSSYSREDEPLSQLELAQLHQRYNPSLNNIQNPIYYEANRILFEAHQMRLCRLQVHKLIS